MGALVSIVGSLIAVVTCYIAWRRHESATRSDVTSRGASANQLRLQREIAAEQRLRAQVQNLTDARAIEREIYRLQSELADADHSRDVVRNEGALKRRGTGVLLCLALLSIALIGLGGAAVLDPKVFGTSSTGDGSPAPPTPRAGPLSHTASSGIDLGSTANHATSQASPSVSKSEAVGLIVKYFRSAGSGDYSSAWRMLSLRYQRQYRSYQRFVEFWSAVRTVGPGDLRGQLTVDTPDEVELSAVVFYVLRSGIRSDERATFFISRTSTGLLIDGYKSAKTK